MSLQEKAKFIQNIFAITDEFPPEIQLIIQARIEGLQEGLRLGQASREQQVSKESA